jgi:hypothetical protein
MTPFASISLDRKTRLCICDVAKYKSNQVLALLTKKNGKLTSDGFTRF